MFEAKYTSGNRLEQSRVLPQQAETLTLHQQLGARCYVIAGFASGRVYRIPWKVWSGMKETFGRKYVREEDLINYLVDVRNGILMLLS